MAGRAGVGVTFCPLAIPLLFLLALGSAPACLVPTPTPLFGWAGQAGCRIREGFSSGSLASWRASSAGGRWFWSGREGADGLLRLRGGVDNARYYEVLKLPVGEEDENAIKKAYRKMALKWHPDRNLGEHKEVADRRFKEVSEAYEVLSNPNNKAFYDKYGEQALKNNLNGQNAGGEAREGFGGGPGGMPGGVHFSFNGGEGGFSDPSKIFEAFFGQSGFGGGSSFSMGGDSFGFGGGSDPFGGMGGFGGSGAGARRQRQAQPIEHKIMCTLEELFVGCTKKFKIGQKVLSVDVKPGWKAGTKVKYDNPPITFTVHEKKHPFLGRDGDDLKWKCSLSRAQSIKGVQLTVPMPDGSEVKVSTKGERVYHGGAMAIAGHGMPIKGGPSRGNLIIEFSICD